MDFKPYEQQNVVLFAFTMQLLRNERKQENRRKSTSPQPTPKQRPQRSLLRRLKWRGSEG